MPERKQNRVRIDAILNAIRKGEYDDKLSDVQGAVNARLEHKRKEVLALVQEVYGEGFVVSQKPAPLPNPGGISFRSGGSGPSPESPDATTPDDSPPVVELTEEEKDLESRSPIIGPHNPA